MFPWRKKSSVKTVEAFIDAMNARDFDAVAKLLADDVRIIDHADRELQGAGPCLALLRRVAELAPDYELKVHDIVARGNDILISGEAQTTTAELATATQWRARASGGLMLEWQSYSNQLTPSMIATVTRSQQ